jgi:hypothetical protein
MLILQIVSVLAGLTPVETAVEDHFDVVHHNRHYNDDGRLVVDQVWWEKWRGETACHEIIGWRMARPGTPCSPIPLRDPRGSGWCSIWLDGGLPRIVRCRSYRRSWTLGVDPELADRRRHDDWRRVRCDLSPPR